jgi:O-antigen/teichoic acid export membrane protein
MEVVSALLFRFAVVLYLVAKGLRLWHLALVTLAEVAVRGLLLVVAARRFSPWAGAPQPRLVDRQVVRGLLSLSVPLFVIALADLVRFQVDAAVIAAFLPDRPDAITTFGVGSRVLWIAYANIGAIGAVLIPRFSGLWERGDRARLVDMAGSATLATGLLALGVLLNAALLGRQFLGLWIGRPWTDESAAVLALLVPGYLAVLIAGPATGVLIASGRVGGLAALTVLEAICNLALSAVLVRPLGVFGVAIGTSLPMLAIRGLVFPILLGRWLAIPRRQLFSPVVRSLRAGAIYLALFGWMAFLSLGWWTLGLATLTGVAAFTGVAYWTVPEARPLLGGWLVLRARRAHAGTSPR